jgi:hypothetical protein
LAIYNIETADLTLFQDKTGAAEHIGVHPNTITKLIGASTRVFIGKYILFNDLTPIKSKRGRKH